jgi:hypothetical protein
MIRRGRTVEVKSSTTPPPEIWVVPDHLKGLSCVLCGFPFQDGDTHGEMQDDQMTLICRTTQPGAFPVIEGSVVK